MRKAARFKAALRRFTAPVPFLLLGIVSIAVSAFVFLNGFELATNVNIPYAFAIEPVPVAGLVADNRSDEVAARPETAVGNFGEPKYLKVATQTTRLPLVPGVEAGGEFLARAAVGHVVLLGTAKSGNLGNALVYLRTSWRSVAHPEQIVPGTNVFVDTDRDWRYMYRVTEVADLAAGTPYLVPDSVKAHLGIAFVSESGTSVRLVLADFVNIQNIQQ